MNNLHLIARRIAKLSKLHLEREYIFVEDIRKEFRADLKRFIAGKTLAERDGKLLVGKNLYQLWLKKIKTRGFDYDIPFRK